MCFLPRCSSNANALVISDYGAQRYLYQEGQRQRFLQDQYQRLAVEEAARRNEEGTVDPQPTEEEAVLENEMPDYIQEEDEEEDPFYFVQAQQRSNGNVYLAASIGHVERVRY